MINILIDGLIEGFFAGLVSMGFALISFPPRRIIIFTALLALIGRSFRYFLVGYFSVNIEWSTFLASMLVGLGGIYLGIRLRTPMEVISFPALLPMLPGQFAYNTILAIVNYGATEDLAEKQSLMFTIFDNGIITMSILTALSVGVIVPLLIFYEKSFTITRARKGKKNE